ncbi:hypothetical protein EJ06DRAFT_545813 [Trichodelitschia bisporula]|uniref:RNA helicase n=1 Tax=Trichodelitschia bisporula TaxID=703511 RepID=A0A6G1IBB5_9PEZI|nr:hypothetical protein EJ06DRAFT_545813 [Trichodelitschia bisporula]
MDLKTWTSDSLTKLGGSDPTVVEFVLATASNAKSASQLHDKLAGFLDATDDDVRTFADQLFARAGHKTKNVEREGPVRVEKKKYALVSMEVDETPVAPPKSAKGDKGSKRSDRGERHGKDRKKLRGTKGDFEDRWGDVSEEEEAGEEEFEEPIPRKRRRLETGSPMPSGRDEDNDDRELERERERDRQELQGLEERLKEKDDKKKRLRDADAPKDTGDIREKSRQQYLRKREAEKVILLRKQVEEEEEEERSNPNLTERELREFKRNRELLEIAEARLKAREAAEDREGFYIPEVGEISKQETLTKRVKEREGISDIQLWEEEQTRRAKATASLRTQRVTEDDYEYVFDDSQKLDFIQGAQIPGTMNKEQLLFQKQIDAALAAEVTLQEKRKELPMFLYRKELLDALKEHQNMIVSSETGSGKTTQIPQYILEENLNSGLMIGVTQPRRVAAMSVAARVAEERGTRLGQEVGYSVRFEQKISEKTKIKFLTDGMLLRELVADPTLSQYSVIMLDEAHERTLSTDMLLAFLKDLSRARSDLKVIISSATLNSAKFSAFMDDCPIFHVPGRTHPVTTLFTSAPEASYLDAAVTTVFQIHLSQPMGGDILVFLTGQDDIELGVERIEETIKKLGNRAKPLVVIPIYANLPSEMQARIFEPTPQDTRKVVLATNIAETSLTIDGIKYVIDSGLAKENLFNPATGTESLQVTPISRASAEQRAGRAGRTGPGTCLRLYTKYSYYSELQEEPVPEIQRSNLCQPVLFLKTIGVDNIIEFDFLDAPSPEALIKSLELLYMLGALASDGRVTRLGRQMVEFPTDPQLAAALIASHKFGCVQEILTIVAMLGEAANLFFRPKDQKVHADSARARFTHKDGGDHMTLLNVYNAWVDTEYSMPWCRENFVQYRSLQRARLVREQLEALCDRVEIPTDSSVGASDHVSVLKALLAGYFSHTATLTRDGQHYRTLRSNLTVRIHPSSVLAADGMKPKVVMYHEVVQTSADWMRQAAPIEAAWLGEVAPHFWKSGEVEKVVGHGRKMPKGQGAPEHHSQNECCVLAKMDYRMRSKETWRAWWSSGSSDLHLIAAALTPSPSSRSALRKSSKPLGRHRPAHRTATAMSASPAAPPGSTPNGAPPQARRRRPPPNPLVANQRGPRKPPPVKRLAPAAHMPSPAAGPGVPSPMSTGTASFTEPGSPLPEDKPSVYPIFTTKRALMEGMRHHVARLQSKQTIDVMDNSYFSPPVRLHRRDPRAPPGTFGSAADLKEEEEDDKEREMAEAARQERQRIKEANAKLIAPAAPSKKKAPQQGFFKKKVEQVWRTDEDPEDRKRSQLRYEEALPWHLEDQNHQHILQGFYEAALSESHVMLLMDGDHFRVLPVEKWYRFKEKNKFKHVDLDEAEATMSKKVKEPRWFMESQKENERKKMMEKMAEHARGRLRVGARDEKVIKTEEGYEVDQPPEDVDWNVEEDFADDEENPILEGDEDTQQMAEERIKRDQLAANAFDLRDAQDVDEEDERERKLAELAEKQGKETRQALMKLEKNFNYKDDDNKNPYVDSDSEADISEDDDLFKDDGEKDKKEDGADDSEGDSDKRGSQKAKARAENKKPMAGSSSKGTNTPNGGKPNAAGKSTTSLKRPGSPNLSEASGNESSRKKAKKQHESADKPPTSLKDLQARQLAQKHARKGAGSGSDTDATAGGKKPGLKIKPGGSKAGTPNGSRAGSPAVGASSNGSRAGSPQAISDSLPSAEAILQSIPKEGIMLAELSRKFRARVDQSKLKDFVRLVKTITHFDPATKQIFPKRNA